MTTIVQLPLFRRETRKRARGSLAERFWRNVDAAGPPDACWLWTGGSVSRQGYARIGAGGKGAPCLFVHRVSWLIAFGPIPPGLFVLHRCDVPLCVNPAHLFLGTQPDNVRDRVSKGRSARGDRSGARLHPDRVPRGERNGQARLTLLDVRAIRDAFAAGVFSKATLARAFGVSHAAVRHIIAGRNWREVGGSDNDGRQRSLAGPCAHR